MNTSQLEEPEVHDVECPYCGSKVGEPCRWQSYYKGSHPQRATASERERVTPRAKATKP